MSFYDFTALTSFKVGACCHWLGKLYGYHSFYAGVLLLQSLDMLPLAGNGACGFGILYGYHSFWRAL